MDWARIGSSREGRQSTRIAHLVHKKEKWWKRHAKSIKARLKIKVKIVWSFYQIAARVNLGFAGF